jgi:hypothetical protein
MSRFYTLGLDRSFNREKCPGHDGECHVVCLNIESIPAYADVSQIVKLHGRCEITQSEVHRWAEPVKYGITRSLSNHLSGALGRNYVLVSLPELNCTNICEHRVCVAFTNFIFNEGSGELLLSANISVFKCGKLVTICEYADRFMVEKFADYDKIVSGMDWALRMLGEFIAHCIDANCVSDGCVKIPREAPCPELAEGLELEKAAVTKVSREADVNAFPRIINISARGEVYVVVDSENGTKRYFSGRLFSGSSIDVKCDSPYRVISTNDELIEVRQ